MIINADEIRNENKSEQNRIIKFLKNNWKVLIILLTPIVFLPLTFTRNPPMLCGYIIFIVVIYWVTGVMNISVTSLIPAVLFPIFGILDPATVAACYMKDFALMLIGGLIVAKTIERQNLHKRFALHILQFIGPNWIFQYLGFMFSTWFISMWISNSSTTVMMTTLGVAVSEKWLDIVKSQNDSSTVTKNTDETNDKDTVSVNTTDQSKIEKTLDISSTYESEESIDIEIQKIEFLSKGLFLGIAYSATCGGMATTTGTPTNYIFSTDMNKKYGSKLNLNFKTFMFFSFPMSLIIIILCWLLLVYRYIGIDNILHTKLRKPEDDKIMKTIKNELNELGSLSYGEISTFIVFIGLVLLWILREPGTPLLSKLFMYKVNGKKEKFWTDGLSGMVAALLVFNLPEKNPFKTPSIEATKLMSWDYIEKGINWGIVFLFGGGFAIAEGCTKSGLTDLIGSAFESINALPHFIIILIVSIGISILTEVTSNMSTVAIMLPVLVHLAECIHMHPMRMGLTVAMSSSFSFCLPAASPPNAIVLGTGKLQVLDMLTSGILLNIICIIVLSFMAYFYSCPIFYTDVFPDWIKLNCSKKKG